MGTKVPVFDFDRGRRGTETDGGGGGGRGGFWCGLGEREKKSLMLAEADRGSGGSVLVIGKVGSRLSKKDAVEAREERFVCDFEGSDDEASTFDEARYGEECVPPASGRSGLESAPGMGARWRR